MRYFVLFLISTVVFAQPNQQPVTQYTCQPGNATTLTSLADSDIVGLQMELFMWSKFQAKTPPDIANLQKAAHEVVFALANEFSAYGDRFQKCSLSDEEYYQKTSQPNSMILLLRETTGFDVPEPGSWPLKDVEPLVGQGVINPAIRGHKLPMNPVMEKVIRAYARESYWWRFRWRRADTTNPVQMAALELLGRKQDWDVKKFKFIK